ncbi:MAG: hypothetical protein Q4E53_00925 [Eubacteriales bacterium]|nr:hypothetical protein [Eubacteriales bacterium]
MKKKILAGILAAAMIGSLAACNTSKTNEKAAETTTEDIYDDGYVDIDLVPSEYMEVGDYKNITIEGAKVEVTDEMFNERLEDELSNYVTYEKTDKKVVNTGDFANISYTCLVDGKKINDFCEDEIEITLGEGQLDYFDGFEAEKKLDGAKVGETVKITGTFSEDIYDEDMAGKEGEMNVTIHYVSKEVMPELTDAFAKENLECNSAEEFKKQIRDELEENAKSEAAQENEYNIFNALVENSKQIKDFPEEAVAAERSNAIIELTELADFYGMEIGDSEEDLQNFFKEVYGMDLDEYVQESLKRYCVTEILFEKENIKASDKEVNDIIEQEMIDGGYESKEEYLETVNEDDIRNDIKYQKLIDLLLSSATIK